MIPGLLAKTPESKTSQSRPLCNFQPRCVLLSKAAQHKLPQASGMGYFKFHTLILTICLVHSSLLCSWKSAGSALQPLISGVQQQSALWPWLCWIFTTAIEISPHLLLLQLKHENLLRSGDSWSPSLASRQYGWLGLTRSSLS